MSGNSDGYLYAAWTDWSESPGTELARRRMSRSPDRGATWESAVTLTSASSDWASSLGPARGFNSLGWHAGSATNGFDLFDVWPDARNSDPDVYGRWVRRRLRLDLVKPDTLEAHPGETVVVQVRVQNLDDVFGWNLRLDATLSRAWPAPSATSALSADPPAATMSLATASTAAP